MRTTTFRVLLVLVAVSGTSCSTPVADPFGFESGTRLKAKYVEGGGTKVLQSFHDTVRNEDCAFGAPPGTPSMVGPGGETYCLPIARPVFRGYADPSCTQRLFEVPTGSAVSVVVDDPTRNCEQHPTVYSLGEPFEGMIYGVGVGGECFESGAAAAPLRRLGAPLPIDTFVRAVETKESTGGRLDRLVLVADDGARVVTGGFDTQRNEAVEGGWDEDEDRWVPRGIAYGDTSYLDPACTRQLATKLFDSAFCPITAVYEFLPLVCNQYGSRWREAGLLLDDAKIFQRSETGLCAEAIDPWQASGVYLVEMKAEIPRTAFAPLQRTEVGEGAITQTFIAEVGQSPLMPSGVLTDRSTGATCSFRPTTDGTLRCVPSATSPEQAYADPSCTELVARSNESTDCQGNTTPVPLAARVSQLDADNVATVYAVAAEGSTLATIYRKQASACTSEPGGTAQWHALTVVDPATLPLGTEKTDP